MDKDPLILVVDDEPQILRALKTILGSSHFRVITAINGEDAIALAATQLPDVIILDLSLPDMDGMRVLKQIRSFSDVPVIILTVRGEETDKVRGLEMGADDYIVKPFSHRELLARIKSVLQHRQKTSSDVIRQDYDFRPDSIEVNKKPVVNRLVIDFTNEAVYKDGERVKLTSTELNLIKYLASVAGQVISANNILTNIWGEEYVGSNAYLQEYMSRLGDKLEDDPGKPEILLKEDQGYKYVQV
jgi:two-component system KDP operon response regulator KdpE